MARRKRSSYKDSDVERAKLYLCFGGFTYETVARRVLGDSPSYQPSKSEVAWVGKLAREENLSSMEWRRGQSDEAKRYLGNVEKKRRVG